MLIPRCGSICVHPFWAHRGNGSIKLLREKRIDSFVQWCNYIDLYINWTGHWLLKLKLIFKMHFGNVLVEFLFLFSLRISFIESCWQSALNPCCSLHNEEQHFRNDRDLNSEPEDYEARIIPLDQHGFVLAMKKNHTYYLLDYRRRKHMVAT